MNEQNKINEELTFGDVWEFFKTYWAKGLIRGTLSFVVLLAVFVLCYFYLPGEEFYNRDIMLQLQRTVLSSSKKHISKSQAEVFCYPNQEPFVHTDLISVAVLKAVYEKNNLKGRVEFDDFTKAFAISDFSTERAKVEAAYRAKLASKNIRLAEINEIENTYRAELRKIPSDWLTVSVKKLPWITFQEMSKIINDVPVEWFRIYSESEAEVLPQIPSPSLLRKLDNSYGRLAALEKMRTYTGQFEKVIKEMNEQLSNRNISLKSGETLGDLLTEVKHISQFQLVVLRQMLMSIPALKSDYDLYFASGRESDINRDLEKGEAHVAAVVSAIEVITPKSSAISAREPGKSSAAGAQLMLDASFMRGMASMIRNDANNIIRQTLAEQMMEYKTETAALIAEKNYFARLRKDYSSTPIAKGSVADYDKLFAECLKELQTTAGKIASFKKLIANEYAVERRFYVTHNSVKVSQNMLIPPVKLAAGIAAFWLLLNCAWLFLAFTKKYKF